MHCSAHQCYTKLFRSLTLSLSSIIDRLTVIRRSNCKPFLEVYENGKKILSTLREPDVMR